MARPRKNNTGLPPYVRVRHGAYHYDKPGEHVKLCRVSEGLAAMQLALERLVHRRYISQTSTVLEAKPVSQEPGIYLMFQRGKCVYVGKAKNVARRVSQRRRLVDSVVMIAEADPARRSELEEELIRLINPTHNVAFKV